MVAPLARPAGFLLAELSVLSYVINTGIPCFWWIKFWFFGYKSKLSMVWRLDHKGGSPCGQICYRTGDTNGPKSVLSIWWNCSAGVLSRMDDYVPDSVVNRHGNVNRQRRFCQPFNLRIGI